MLITSTNCVFLNILCVGLSCAACWMRADELNIKEDDIIDHSEIS